MSTTYENWHPGTAVATAAERYTQLVKDKSIRTPKQPRPDQHERNAAQQLTCPNSPATSGPLTHHSFGFNETTCAFCGETPAWILAAPTN